MANPLMIRQATQAAIATSETEATAERALLEFQSPTAALIALPVPLFSRLTLWLVSSLVVFGLVALSVIKVDRIVSASGQVVSLSPNLVVQPLETSIVRSIDVQEGQVVHTGDLLARLDPTFAQDDVKSTTDQAESLQAEVNRLTAELNDKPYVADNSTYGQLQALLYSQRQDELHARMESYQQKINSLQVKVQQAQKDIASLTKRLQGARQIEAMRSELEHLQIGSKLNTLSAQDSRRQLEGQLDNAKSAEQGGQRDLAAMVAERNDYIHQWRVDASQQLATQGRHLADMLAQAGKNNLRHKLVDLKAEQDGIVLSVARVSVGTVLQSGAEFIKMVPLDAQLQVEAFIPGSQSGFVHVGDSVAVKFDTLPYFQYGYGMGTVRSISPDSFVDPREGRGDAAIRQADIKPAQGPVGVLYYRAHVSLDQLKLRNLPESFRLVPGMPLKADIKVGERPIMGYLLARIVPNLSEGMREP